MIKETKNIPYEDVPPAPSSGIFLKLNRNLAFLMLLLVCLASIHNQKLPDGQTVLTAVQSTLDENWDESLGKITFVDHMIPQTLAVFLDASAPVHLSLPCNGTLSHLWEDAAPYLSFAPSDSAAFAVADGEVMHLSHGADDTLSLRIRHENGLETVYYQLSSVSVSEGDHVAAASPIGQIKNGSELVLDVRKNGLSVNPLTYFAGIAP